MATDLRVGSTGYLPALGAPNVYRYAPLEIDFSETTAGATDLFNTYYLKANTLVRVFVNRIVAEGATCTIDMVTTESSPQTFLNDASLNGTGWLYGDGADGDATAVELLILEDCTLNLLANTAATDAAKIQIHVLVTDLQFPTVTT